MAWTQDELNGIQTYLQMYDKGLLSSETVLEKLGLDSEKEKKEIKKDIEFHNERYCGVSGKQREKI